jgi:prephenate dehydrogenase
MTVKITIIGTGQIGASIGLALGAQKDLFLRIGHDKDPKVANRAKVLGAVDKVEINLFSAIADAAIVILSLPLDQIHETLQLIAQDLKEDAVIMDTAPVKGEVFKWVQELLPPQRYYIGLVPVINPAYLNAPGEGVEAARANLFKDGLIAILTPGEVPSEAIKLAIDFSHLLGAAHLFIDQLELDSMMSAIHILPQLVAAAVVNTSVDQPGWKDARKLTGRPYAFSTGAVAQAGEVISLSGQAISTQEHLLRRMDALIDYLDTLRQQIAAGETEKLQHELEHASQGHENWLKERTAANWAVNEIGATPELPTARQVFTRMFTFGGGRKPKPPK